MPGSEHHNLEQLNYAALQNFIDTDVSGFLHRIDDLRAPGAHPTSLYDIGKKPQVLTIGPMAGDDQTGGKNLCDSAKKAASAIDSVLKRHRDAFAKLKIDLGNVIRDMKKTEGDNLANVKSNDFMREIGDYTSAIGGSSTGAGTGAGNNLPL